MSIILDGTTIEKILFNETSLKKVIYDGVVVWSAVPAGITITLTASSLGNTNNWNTYGVSFTKVSSQTENQDVFYMENGSLKLYKDCTIEISCDLNHDAYSNDTNVEATFRFNMVRVRDGVKEDVATLDCISYYSKTTSTLTVTLDCLEGDEYYPSFSTDNVAVNMNKVTLTATTV